MPQIRDNYSVFMQSDLSSFVGEWIAICDGKIVSHNVNLKRAFESAKKNCPNKRPLIARIPSAETMLF